jgi:plasmid stabilization system protein ParE
MTIKVVVLASAKQDLIELRAYLIKNFSPSVWQQSYQAIKDATRRLQQFPRSGTIPGEIEKLNLSQYRQVICGMNRIIYELRGDMIYLHAIVDARREMTLLLTRRMLRVL